MVSLVTLAHLENLVLLYVWNESLPKLQTQTLFFIVCDNYNAARMRFCLILMQGLDGPSGDKGDDGEPGQPVSVLCPY